MHSPTCTAGTACYCRVRYGTATLRVHPVGREHPNCGASASRENEPPLLTTPCFVSVHVGLLLRTEEERKKTPHTLSEDSTTSNRKSSSAQDGIRCTGLETKMPSFSCPFDTADHASLLQRQSRRSVAHAPVVVSGTEGCKFFATVHFHLRGERIPITCRKYKLCCFAYSHHFIIFSIKWEVP